MTQRNHFVHSVLARISPVAVHPRSSLGIRDEAADVGEEVHQAGVGRATEDLAELLVSDDNDRAGLLGKG